MLNILSVLGGILILLRHGMGRERMGEHGLFSEGAHYVRRKHGYIPKERGYMQILVAIMFCLQCPGTVHVLCSYQYVFKSVDSRECD